MNYKKIKSLIAIQLTVFMLCHALYGQAGSEAYQVVTQLQLREAENEAKWNAARQLRSDEHIPAAEPSRDKSQSMPLNAFRSGDVGRLDYWVWEVIQVTDGSLILATNTKTIILQDVDATDITTGLQVVIIGPVLIGPTVTYRSLNGGTNTVHSVRFVGRNAYQSLIALNEEKQAQQLSAEYPSWESKAGTKVRAKFLRYFASRVEMETLDGRKIRVQLSDFTDTDAERIRFLIRKQNEKPEPPASDGSGYYGPSR